jgi:hypothetical protein
VAERAEHVFGHFAPDLVLLFHCIHSAHIVNLHLARDVIVRPAPGWGVGRRIAAGRVLGAKVCAFAGVAGDTRVSGRVTLHTSTHSWGVGALSALKSRLVGVSVALAGVRVFSFPPHQWASAPTTVGRIDPDPAGTYIGRREDVSTDRGGTG